MLVSRIDRLLARTDPFDLSQAVERHVRSLSGERIRALLRDAAPRLGAYYRDEFARLTGSTDFETALTGRDPDLQSAFVKFLKSNLRAIPIFGSPFGLAVLEHAPLDRAVGIGEERANPVARSALVGGVALALLMAGAIGEHVIAGARVAAQTPQAVVLPPPAFVPTATPAPHQRVMAAPAATASPVPSAPRALARVTTSHVPTPVPAQASEPIQPAISDPAPTAAPAPPRPKSSPPSGGGVGEVTAAPQTPSPQPSDLDVTDMPESYTDATPMPQQSPVTVQVPQRGIKVPTPKPSPKKPGWVRRALSHLNPFKPDS